MEWEPPPIHYLIVLVLSFLQVEKQLPEKPSVLSPADIYSQFTPKQELKSILRRPSVEEKESKSSLENKLATTQQLPTNSLNENNEKEEFNSEKVSCWESSSTDGKFCCQRVPWATKNKNEITTKILKKDYSTSICSKR